MSRLNKKLNLFSDQPSSTLSAQPSTNINSPNLPIPIINTPSSTKSSSLASSSNVTSLPSINPNTQKHSNPEFNKTHLSLNFSNTNSTSGFKNQFSSSFANIKNKDLNKLDETKMFFESENNQFKLNNNRHSVLTQINSSFSDQALTPNRNMMNRRSELKILNFGNGYFSEPKNLRKLDLTKTDKVYFELNDSTFKSPLKSTKPLSLNLSPSRSSSPSSLSLSSSTNSLSRLEAIDSDKFRKIMVNSGYLLIGQRRIQVTIDQLSTISLLGHGTSGVVTKMKHKPTGFEMAVKQMSISGIEEENKRILTDVDVIAKSNNCKNIVKCLGYTISESDVWIFMELMLSSFDELLTLNNGPIPENIIGKLSVSILSALNYLKEKHNMMHRDIKPSNILIDENGEIKLCDFGISGRLVNSKAFSKNTIGNFGSAGYTAPERIQQTSDYDVRADIWSFGISVIELANGEYPYKNCKFEFEILSAIIDHDPPELKGDHFSDMFKSFIKSCLQKDFRKRPKYNTLLSHEFIKYYEEAQVDVKGWLYELLKKKERSEPKKSEGKCSESN